jgi:hypothetical protein
VLNDHPLACLAAPIQGGHRGRGQIRRPGSSVLAHRWFKATMCSRYVARHARRVLSLIYIARAQQAPKGDWSKYSYEMNHSD